MEPYKANQITAFITSMMTKDDLLIDYAKYLIDIDDSNSFIKLIEFDEQFNGNQWTDTPKFRREIIMYAKQANGMINRFIMDVWIKELVDRRKYYRTGVAREA
jgi:hypothetical protein